MKQIKCIHIKVHLNLSKIILKFLDTNENKIYNSCLEMLMRKSCWRRKQAELAAHDNCHEECVEIAAVACHASCSHSFLLSILFVQLVWLDG